jgi:GNAT superfamily N-acetyltransferase
MAAVHRLIYDEARWADVPGHAPRELDEWRSLFVDGEDPEQQVLAWHSERLVGVALGKTFSGGMGWVSQLAVAPDQQGRGLGSALLAEALRRRLDGGATQLGLGVSAANPDALRLYERLGFRIDREWMAFRAGRRSDPTSVDVGAQRPART